MAREHMARARISEGTPSTTDPIWADETWLPYVELLAQIKAEQQTATAEQAQGAA